MMMAAQRTTLVMAACMAALLARPQVGVDKPILLNGSQNTDKQVRGLRDAASGTDGLNARTLQAGEYQYAEVQGGSLWEATLTPPLAGLNAGLCLLLRSTDANSGPVTLSLNGGAPIGVVNAGGAALQSGAIAAGETVSVVYDGTAFQLIGARRLDRKPCPSGTVQVNDLYCIEVQERDTMHYPEAAVACGNANMSMCSWAQWYYACTQATNLGLQDMIGEWEWTNSAANSDIQARIVGFSSCTQAAVANGWSTLPQHYRCCFKR